MGGSHSFPYPHCAECGTSRMLVAKTIASSIEVESYPSKRLCANHDTSTMSRLLTVDGREGVGAIFV